ncbi:MAG: septum site-determining protein MinC [Lachnoclostridium sp.]|jgi:septum site-determining protein MinC|nr:septum site-determining protein MinC [Lachnoclostridium sp.]
MKHTPVVIKGTKSGIIVVLDKQIPMEQLKTECVKKFIASRDFLGKSQVAISFEGKSLSDQEEIEFVDLISANSDLDIVCIIDNNEKREALFNRTLNERLKQLDSNTGNFYKGTLRSGQVLEFETSVIMLGDVNVGAQVVSTGNVVILGALKGNVYAGAAGNPNAFVAALKMSPKQIRISDVIARAPDGDDSIGEGAKIAFVEDNNIYIEPLTKEVLGDIRL